MLFNSYEFIFFYVPVTLCVFFLIGRMGRREWAIAWMALASLFFYGWWNPIYLGLISVSILFNYSIGVSITRHRAHAKKILALGVTVDLGLLGYYKYANFFVDNLNTVASTDFHLSTIILPLGISFFTFTQIAYLVDAYRGETREYNFIHYCLFVTIFPHLIAGPIIHHRQTLPQFSKSFIYRPHARNLAVGISIFVLGLFKKVVIADGVSVYANPVFSAAEAGQTLSLWDAWGGALAYSFQLYFDFSGYSDMAIGLARMFNVWLPLNFRSPYKADNIIEFWRRWHMTLSRFLRDYLYVPLGGSRKGSVRTYVNLLLTMLLGGLWHGAGWTFVIWGGLHGLYLVINHGWQGLMKKLRPGHDATGRAYRLASRTLTFLAVVVAWVYFRAETLPAANSIMASMIGLNGIILPESWQASGLFGASVQFGEASQYLNGKGLRWLIVLLLVAWIAPNTQELMRRQRPAQAVYPGDLKFPRHAKLIWRPTLGWALTISAMALLALSKIGGGQSEFLYFQF